MATCAECKLFVCRTGHLEAAPENCPMRDGDVTDTRRFLEDPTLRQMARESALVEAEGYVRWTRLEETMQFARRMGYKKLGVAFCVGLREEGKMLSRILEANGFEVASAACKCGSIPKEEVGIADSQKVRPGSYEPLCNPIGQAMVLKRDQTDFNILFGLCVGHDTLFIQHSAAPVTCLVAKDRVMAHNPIGAIYASSGYYRRRLYEGQKP
ncbi:MAG: DUF1847 domain-containing protein [Chloroflexota bacterium]